MPEKNLLASQDYLDEVIRRINDDSKYAELAAGVNDSYSLVLQAEPDKGIPKTKIVGFTIKDGKMTDIWEGDRKTSFILTAPYAAWVSILKGKVSANRAFITRKLKVQGKLARLLKTAKATDRLVVVLRTIPTQFEGEYESQSFP